ncbi:MAG: hypothetical protein H7Z74_07430 [Anaerolineae bacterium]|nr:hypothetical protein [Gemmatimonadaceae bacterium]
MQETVGSAIRSARMAVTLAAVLAGCASGSGGGTTPDTTPQPGTTSPSGGINSTWPVTTRLHIDLWLHGYAMVQEDTTLIPFFKRGYAEQMRSLKSRANATTQLELNRDRLRARLALNPGLINAQFLALSFSTWETMQGALEVFLQADGDPNRSNDRQTQIVIATIAQYFPAAADREWLRVLLLSLKDEHDVFYRAYWTREQQDRQATALRVDSLWEQTYRPKLNRYLRNSQLEAGTFYLSLPLDGEGRTTTGGTREENAVTVAFPESPSSAIDAIYVFAHEAIIAVAGTAVRDNTTPVEKRNGLSDLYNAVGAVRGGAMLLKRAAPEIHDGYMRYYLQAANVTPPSTNLEAAFFRTFPLPQGILDAITRQLDIVLGGI